MHEALGKASQRPGPVEREEPRPAIAVKKSVTPDYIICLEDGKKFKSLKRHLRTHYNLSPEEYPGKVGAAARLSDGGAQPCGGPLAACQADGPWHPSRQIGLDPRAPHPNRGPAVARP